LILLVSLSSLYSDINFYREGGQKVFLESIHTIRSHGDIKLYRKSNGKEVGIKDSFFIKVARPDTIVKLLDKYQLKHLKRYTNNRYLVSTTDPDILTLIEKIFDENDTIEVYPNFYKKAVKR